MRFQCNLLQRLGLYKEYFSNRSLNVNDELEVGPLQQGRTGSRRRRTDKITCMIYHFVDGIMLREWTIQGVP